MRMFGGAFFGMSHDHFVVSQQPSHKLLNCKVRLKADVQCSKRSRALKTVKNKGIGKISTNKHVRDSLLLALEHN